MVRFDCLGQAVHPSLADHDYSVAGSDLKHKPVRQRSGRVPTLVLAGDDDQVVPYKDGPELQAKLLKKPTLKIYPGYAHGMLTTHADIITPDILAFLKS